MLYWGYTLQPNKVYRHFVISPLTFSGLLILCDNMDKNGELSNINKIPAEIWNSNNAGETFVRKELQVTFYELSGYA